jgi:hypothetical protein
MNHSGVADVAAAVKSGIPDGASYQKSLHSLQVLFHHSE